MSFRSLAWPLGGICLGKAKQQAATRKSVCEAFSAPFRRKQGNRRERVVKELTLTEGGLQLRINRQSSMQPGVQLYVTATAIAKYIIYVFTMVVASYFVIIDEYSAITVHGMTFISKV